MKRLVVLLVMLSAGVARADGDEVDDHPLASDLRAAFGRALSVCHGDECSFELRAIECTTRGTATTCRADQRRASGAPAAQLANHLREISSDQSNRPQATTVKISKISCRSYKVEGQGRLRGHCWVERTPGDAALDGVLVALKTDAGGPRLETCKVGQFCWTGTVQISCQSERCTLACPAGSEAAEWLDACHLGRDQVVQVDDAAFAKLFRTRAGSSAGTVSCFSSGTIDGGVTSLVACDVRPRRVAR